MNVNDVICVGAEPISFVDYLAVQKPDPKILGEIAKGLALGAEKAGITIVGGEIAQLPEMIMGKRENCGFDLVGMCVGIVKLDKIIMGKGLTENDVVVGFESSGIHSNGLTLARKVLLEKAKLKLDNHIDELGRSLGEELLEPTKIYVAEVLEMIKKGLKIKVAAHITGKGILNLLRVGEGFGFEIENMPEPPAIFKLIQKYGKISDEEMYRVYNMGIGFCLVLPKNEAEEALTIAEKHGTKGWVLGKAVKDPEKKLVLKPKRLIGVKGKFVKF
ncbi:MAG: phosphoribosylformylglycinamidine cyclo-ligase [Candidatus Hecatellales archaeon]|nr:MAG: phosphoribosylformylglycinamidine cyclo-ligase [Candidatus Hecatellales archaeon]